MNARILAALALALWLPSSLAAQGPTGPDAGLRADIHRTLRTYDRLTIFDDIQVVVSDGIVTLTGKVTLAAKKDDIAARISALDGVRGLRNEIGVLPRSSSDDELRQRVARAIYGNPAFHRYAAMPRPPIHILVEHGLLTLTGVVHTEVERTLARALAAGQGARAMTCALRTEAEVRTP